MPELPEIETIKLQLQKHIVGQTIRRLEKLHSKSVQGNPENVVGKKITGIRRLGKMLIIDLAESWHLAIHFKMSGQLVLVRSSQFEIQSKDQIGERIVGGHPTENWTGKLPSKHTRSIFYLDNGDCLFFNDQRIFGWVKILTTKSLKELAFLKNLGPELWDISDKQFYTLIARRKKAIKLVIMDQSVISGVGNIYANDGLWEARIHPKVPGQNLTFAIAKLLRSGLIRVLQEGIKYGGATAADAKYINLDGLGGHYQEHFRVYDREGKKCLRSDGGIIKKIVLSGRGTYFCPTCQRLA